MGMPDVSLDLAQIVAIGPFNPHIVEPGWLCKQGICDEAEFGGFDIIRNADDADEVFQFGKEEWLVNFSRLSISTDAFEAGVKAAEAIIKVLQKLPHTPVRAVGHNFHFSCRLSELGDRSIPMPKLGDSAKPIVEGFQLNQSRWGGGYEGPNSRIEVTFTIAMPEGIGIVVFNHERQIKSGDSVAAIQAVKEFSGDHMITRLMLADLFHLSP
jgi:hypothetical protein